MIYNISDKQKVLLQLGEKMNDALTSPDFDIITQKAKSENGWFTEYFIRKAVKNWSIALSSTEIAKWLDTVILNEKKPQFKIGLILAGNIPLVGLHDILCVYLTNHKALIKLSSQDSVLVHWVISILVEIDPQSASQFEFVERLTEYDAVIATGSNNSSRYFEQYFANKPHIIRKNRNSIAILTGDETADELTLLGADILDYFGLGCRNVTLLLVPENYDWQNFWQAMLPFQPLANHHKYANNFDYHLALALLNLDPHTQNGFLLLKASSNIASAVGCVHYHIYEKMKDAIAFVQLHQHQLQCVVSGKIIPELNNIPFGKAQCPTLTDYADNVNTIDFLNNLNIMK